MKKLILMISVITLSSCSQEKKEQANDDQNKHSDAYKENFMEDLWKLYPGWASTGLATIFCGLTLKCLTWT